MKTIQPQSTRLTIVLVALAICLFSATRASATVIESARMLPDDMTVMISVESFNDLRAAIEETSFYDLIQDPALASLARDAETQLREHIDETIADFWNEAGVENPPEQLPYPEGRLIFGMSFAVKEPSTGTSGDEGADLSEDDMVFRLVLLADVSGKTEQFRQLIRSLTTGAENTGDPMRRIEIAGVELETFAPDEDSGDPTIFYGLKDNWLLLSADSTHGTDFTEAIIRRIDRSTGDTLADNPGLVAAARTLGEAHAFVFVNADSLRQLAIDSTPNKAIVERIIAGVGLKSVTGLASAVTIAGERHADLSTKTLLAVDGPKTGIPALLALPAAPLRLNDRLITQDTVQFTSLNLEPTRLYDGIRKMVSEIIFLDINMMVQSAMAATAGDGGQPPVQLRDDLLAQMAAPLVITRKSSPTMQVMDRRLEISNSLKLLAAFSVRDGARLDAALDRIHRTLLGNASDFQRELLDHTIYLLPTSDASESRDGEPSATQHTVEGLAFSVVDDTLVLGAPIGDVEQAVRSLRGQPDDSLASDPMFRYARRYLPAQAGIYHYRNNRLDVKESWEALRLAARDLAARENNDPEFEETIANPMAAALRQLGERIDLSTLPEFREIEEHWGATVGFMQDRPEGLYWESTVLKAPQE